MLTANDVDNIVRDFQVDRNDEYDAEHPEDDDNALPPLVQDGAAIASPVVDEVYARLRALRL